MRRLITIVFLAFLQASLAQVGINTTIPSNNAALDIQAPGGFIMPTLNLIQQAAMNPTSDDDGLLVMIIDGTLNCMQIWDGQALVWREINCINNDELLLSEYIEFGGVEKYIEIYNPTTSIIDLTDYHIYVLRNGGLNFGDNVTDRDINLIGTIAPGATFVLADNASTGWGGTPQQVATLLDYNGDDPVVLAKNGTFIDVFGIPGTDPGSGYAVDGEDTVMNAIRRNLGIINPVTVWDTSEWNAAPNNDYSNLGIR